MGVKMGVFDLDSSDYSGALDAASKSLEASAPPSPVASAPINVKPSNVKTSIDHLFDSAAEKYAPYAGVDKSVMSNMLKRIAHAESGFDPNIVNTASGATGLMQIMPSNFEYLGITNPKDPFQSIQGAAYLLVERLRKQKGDWLKAVATYNGSGAHIADGQWKPETLGYVNKIFGAGADKALLSGGSIAIDPSLFSSSEEGRSPQAIERSSGLGAGPSSMAAQTPRQLERSSGLTGATDAQERAIQKASPEALLSADEIKGLRTRAKLAEIDGSNPVEFFREEAKKLIAQKRQKAVTDQPIDKPMAVLDIASRMATGPSKMINDVGYLLADQVGADTVANYFKRNSQSMQAYNAASDQSQKIENSIGRDVYRGVQSAAEQALPAIGSGFGPAVMGVSAGLSQGGSGYQAARDSGLDKADSLANAVVQGGLEGVGEAIGAGAINKVLKAGAGRVLPNLARAVVMEPAQETVTQIGQSAMDQQMGIGGRAKGDWNQYAEMLPAELQTAAIGGLVGAGVFGGTAAGVNTYGQLKEQAAIKEAEAAALNPEQMGAQARDLVRQAFHGEQLGRRDAALVAQVDPVTGITQPLSAEQLAVATKSHNAAMATASPIIDDQQIEEVGTPNQDALLSQLGGDATTVQNEMLPPAEQTPAIAAEINQPAEIAAPIESIAAPIEMPTLPQYTKEEMATATSRQTQAKKIMDAIVANRGDVAFDSPIYLNAKRVYDDASAIIQPVEVAATEEPSAEFDVTLPEQSTESLAATTEPAIATPEVAQAETLPPIEQQATIEPSGVALPNAPTLGPVTRKPLPKSALPDNTRDSVLEFIAKHGGIDPNSMSAEDLRASLGIEKGANLRVTGIKHLFASGKKNKGFTVDDMSGMLRDAGYLEAHDSLELINRLSGGDFKSINYDYSKDIESNQEEQAAQENAGLLMDDNNWLQDFNEADFDEAGFFSLPAEDQAQVGEELNLLVQALNKSGNMADAYKEDFYNEFGNEYEDKPKREYDNALASYIETRINAEAGSGQATRESTSGREDADFTLEAETNAEILQKEKLRKDAEAAQREKDLAPSADEFSLTGSNRNADVAAARGEQDLFADQDNEDNKPRYSKATPDRMMAIHNISEDGLKFADKMGGLAVPSIGVIQQEKGGVAGFGEITLIGNKNLADPSKVPAFSADAYTARFPRPSWSKVNPTKAVAITKQFDAAEKEFDDNSHGDMLFEYMVNEPNAEKAIQNSLGSPAAMAMFLRERGFAVKPATKSTKKTAVPKEKLHGMYTLIRDVTDAQRVKNLSDEETENTPEFKKAAAHYADIIAEVKQGKPESLIKKMQHFDMETLRDVISDIKAKNVTDRYASKIELSDKIEKNKLQLEFKKWAEDKILPAFGEPVLMVGKAKKPYTLRNIVDSMTSSSVVGKEKTMAFGAGAVRAANAIQFSDIEQMREAAKSSIVNVADYEEAKKTSEKVLESFREMAAEFSTIKNYRGQTDIFEAADAAMRAIAKFGTSRKQDKATLQAIMGKEDFSNVPDSVLEQGIAATKALMAAPVPYFEAKPQRAVGLNEFSGAVIPKKASAETRKILDDAGISYVEYDSSKEGTRADAIKKFTKQLSKTSPDVLFSRTEEEQGSTKEELTAALDDALGADVVARLLDSGRLVFDSVEGGNQAKFDGNTITLDPSVIGADAVLAVLLHEVSHESKTTGGAFGKHYEAMQKTLAVWAKAKQGSPMGEFMAAVDARVENSGETGEIAMEERLAYAVEEAVAQGNKAPRTVQEWIKAAVNAVKTQLAKLAVKYKLPLSPSLVTPELLVYLAKLEAGRARGDIGATRYSRPMTPKQGRAYDLPEYTVLDEATTKIQNQLNRWRDVQKAVIEQGGTVADDSDIYGAMIRMPGRAASRMTDFENKEVRPLIDRMAKAKIELGSIEEYLYAMHAAERNAAMKTLNPNRADNDALSGMSNTDAAKIIADAKDRADYAEFKSIADAIQAITKKTQQALIAGGVLSQEQADAYNDKYERYVPLKGFEIASDEDGRISHDQKGKGFSPAITFKRATGRKSRAGDIFANIIRDREMAVMATEKNRVALTAAKFIADNKDDTLWTIGKPEKMPVVVNGLVQWRAMPQLADNEFNIFVRGQKVRIQINDPILAEQFKKMNQEQMVTGLAVMEKYNRLLAEMWTAKNPVFIMVNPMRDLQSGTIQLMGELGLKDAAAVTKYYGPALKAAWQQAKNGEVSDPEMNRIMGLYRANGGNTGAAWVGDLERAASKLERMLDDARGNNVGRILSDVRAGNVWSATKQVAYKAVNNSLIDYIDHANSATENAFRVAAFAAALDAGKSVAQAAVIAKNVTVNFNQKGDMTPWLRSLYIFWNPAVQGATRIKEALVDSPHKKQVWAATAGLVAFGAMQPLLWAMMGAGDEWENIPDSEKERNWIIPMPDGGRLNIPKPYGWGWFDNIGRNASEVALGMKKPIRAAGDIFSSATQNFSPIGIQGDLDIQNAVVAFTPTIGKTAVMTALNRNSFGRPLMPEGRQGTPDSSKMNRNTRGTVYDAAAEAMNSATGGNKFREGAISVSPETIKMLVEYHLGGTGRFVAKGIESASLAAQGETPDTEQLPFVSTFIKAKKFTEWKGQYYEAKREIEQAALQYKQNLKEGNDEGVAQAEKEFGDLIYMGGYVGKVGERLKKIEEWKQEIRDSEMPFGEKRAAEKLLEKEEGEAMKEVVDEYKANRPKQGFIK